MYEQFNKLNDMELSNYERKSIEKLEETIFKGKWSNAGLVELIKLVFSYLNPISLQKYAEQEGISYPGALKRNVHVDILGQRFFLDNE